jgi:hypothetical protein
MACGHHAPLPVLAAPAPSPREDALPALPLASMVIPLSVPLGLVQELVHEHLPLPSADDWLTVTGEGDSPEVAIRYQTQLGALALSFEGPLVHIALPIDYYGSFRARADTPFGSLWLTKNTRWGSREQPGNITLRVSSRLSLSPDWQLAASSTLDAVELTAPDVDKLCAGKVFKVCVPIELARDRVHRELDKQVRAQVVPGLATLDAQLAARLDLRGLVQRVWQQLHAPHATPGGPTLALAPETLTLGHPRLQGDNLVLELQVSGRPSWGDATPAAAPALPAASESDAVRSDVPFWLPISLAELTQHWTSALAAETNAAGYRVSQLELLGPASTPGRWLWAATLHSETATARVYGEGSLESAGAGVSLRDVRLMDGAEPLLAATGFDLEQLSKALSRPADLAANLAERLRELRAALADSVAPFPVTALPDVNATLLSAHAARSGLVFSAVAR